MLNEIRYYIFRYGGQLASRLFLKLRIEGRENLPPPGSEPLLIISNHFSWIEGPVIAFHLPYRVRFMAARELQRTWFMRQLLLATRAIPVWRGTPDRTALRTAINGLKKGDIVAIFPEGGVNPELQARITAGEQITEVQGHLSRKEAVLAPIRPGAALLATASGARVLPIAVSGGENFIDNFGFPWRRTEVEMKIGEPFGPLVPDRSLRGTAKRAQLDAFGEQMMRRLALLFPPEKRGPYA